METSSSYTTISPSNNILDDQMKNGTRCLLGIIEVYKFHDESYNFSFVHKTKYFKKMDLKCIGFFQ